ncbi:hypothetical protein PINS_up020677 [Pythium insidiosum]|nr:hypothetical protein PINS_up020677 [Pythium insidiosum]
MEHATAHTKDVITREFAEREQWKAAPRPCCRQTLHPESYGLDKDFVLTNFSALKGCGCKLPQEKLLGYLDNIANDLKPNETPGMDSSVVKIGHGNDLYLVSTTDFFFPSVEDPYVQGQ